jgi:hypothetical protein
MQAVLPTAGVSAKAELQRYLSTPPTITITNAAHNHNPATMVHAALERLRDSGDEHCLFLRTLLEMLSSSSSSSSSSSQHQQQQQAVPSDDELLLFHCITGCRHVVLHGWRRFSTIFISGLRDWMMLLGHHYFFGTTTNRTLQVACYTTSVALWKRGWLDMVNNNNNTTEQQQHQQQSHNNSLPLDARQQSLLHAMTQSPPNLPIPNNNTLPFVQNPLSLFQYLDHAISMESTTPQHVIMSTPPTTAIPAALFLQAFVEEFSGTKSPVTYQLPLEFHRLTRQAFEKHPYGLTACLQLTMKTLSQLLPHLAVTSPTTTSCTTSDQIQLSILAQHMMQMICDILEWEFGMDAFTATVSYSSSSSTLVRPPKEWSHHHLTTPAFAQALWATHTVVRNSHNNNNTPRLAHDIRQVLVLVASLEGPIFAIHTTERKDFLAAVLRGTLELLQWQVVANTNNNSAGAALWQQQQPNEPERWTELLDTLRILGRILTNGKWSLLIQFHDDPLLLTGLLQGLTSLGQALWEQHIQAAQQLQGNLEQMEYSEEREDVLSVLLEAVVAVSGDPWLWYGNEEQRTWARQLMGHSLGPLYGIWAHGRMQLAGLEEHYLVGSHSNDNVEEEYEHISDVRLEEEMESLSTLGRIHVQGSIQSLSNLFQQTIPQLQAHWNAPPTDAGVSPDLAALLEQARLLTLYIGHLLTDDNTGETPVIPDTVAIACREEDDATIPTIVSAIEALISLAQTQAVQLAKQPNDPRLSPLLANSFLWFINRWAPAYIYSVEYNSVGDQSPVKTAIEGKNIGNVWSLQEKAQQAVSFAVTLCLHFQCYWPQERPVQESAATLLLTLAKRAAGSDHQRHPRKLRTLMTASPSFTQLVMFHCVTAGTRHSMGRSELEQTIHSKMSESKASVDMAMVMGYQRLPYDIKSKILTALLVGCSEHESVALLHDCLKAVHDSFSSLLHAFS